MNNHFFEQKDCGLQAFWSSTPQFKTARVSAHLVLPLTTPENAALYALVPNMISRATREYPDYTQFGKRLAELYGASVQPGVTRVGDNQILTLAAAGIANPYAFGGEDVQQALSEMLESILFTPLCDENGLFPEDGFLQEQRQLLETLDAEYNDKATYAMQRCVQTMFAGEPAGVPRIGTREAILNATREGVKAAWEYAVKHAQICQFTIGDGADDLTAHAQLGQVVDADQQAVEVAAQNLGGVSPGLLVGQLHLGGVVELRMAAQLGQAGLEGDAGTGGGVGEDHAEALVLQQLVVALAAIQLMLQIQGLIDEPLLLGLGEIHDAEEVLASQSVHCFLLL